MSLKPIPERKPRPERKIVAVKPPSILLIGRTGTGKTWSIVTALAAGLETFVIVTEPNGADTLIESFEYHSRLNDKFLRPDRLHWHYVAPAAPGWEGLKEMAKNVSNMGYDDLTKIKSGIAKDKTRQFAELLSTLHNFRCDHCGAEFGDVSLFDDNRLLAIDSLSGLNIMAMDLTIGLKPAAHQGEWGVAMNLLEKLILQCTSELNCYFVMTGHIQKQSDILTGATTTLVDSLGQKLAPKIPRFFSEVVLAVRNKDGKFRWSTAESSTDLKNRGLTFSSDLLPNFQAVIDFHRRRQQSLGVS